MQVAILAGGLGTRLRPYTYKIPKSMIPINGKPYLSYQLKYLKQQGISDIALLVGYLGERIMDYFKDGLREGLNIKYSKENNPLGTGGALKLAENILDKNFFVIYGDSYIPLQYSNLKLHFNKIKKTGMLVVYNNKHLTDVPNNVSIDENNIVTKYIKNTKDQSLKFVEAGVMAFRKEILNLIEPNKFVSLEEDIFPILIQQGQLSAYVTNKKFYDIGTPSRLKRIEGVLK